MLKFKVLNFTSPHLALQLDPSDSPPPTPLLCKIKWSFREIPCNGGRPISCYKPARKETK